MGTAPATLAMLGALAGAPAVRRGTAEDAIDGVRPDAVVEPDTAELLAGVLARASAARLSVVVRGGGTKLSWGRVPSPIDVLVSTRRLSRVVAHAHGDLTAEVQAGVTLRALNDALSRERQWLPLESAFDEATIGGLLATNDTGPARHHYGAPRDLLIGVRLATADGRLVKAGGNVVKNVAGYDLGRLVTGSFGSLAAIVGATFKLTPMAAATATRRFRFAERSAAAGAAQAAAASQIEPIALEVHAAGGIELLARFASTPVGVQDAAAAMERLIEPFGPESADGVSGAADAALWRSYVRRPWEGPGAVVQVAWLPASLDAVLACVQEIRAVAPVALAGRVAVGAGLLRVDAGVPEQVEIVRRLRVRADLFTHASLLRAPVATKAAVDVWGDRRPAAALQDAIKRALDPAGILNAGRGPL